MNSPTQPEPALPGSTPGRPGGRFASAAVLLFALSQSVSGCSAPLDQAAAGAVNQGSSAVGTSALSLDLLARERAGKAAVGTSLEDMAGELEDARKKLQDNVPATPDERTLHGEVRRALERAEGALGLARQALEAKDSPGGDGNTPALQGARSALAASAKELDALRQRLGTGR